MKLTGAKIAKPGGPDSVNICPKDAAGNPLITAVNEAGETVSVDLVLRRPQPSDYFAAQELAEELMRDKPDWTNKYAAQVGLLGICHVSPEPDGHPAAWYAEQDAEAGDVLLFIIGEFSKAFPSRLAGGAKAAIKASKND